ncbi:MAG: hypothetical protein AAF909_01795 [Pseudomonadota bacterium]
MTPSHLLLLLALGVLAGRLETDRIPLFLVAFLLGLAAGVVALGGYALAEATLLAAALTVAVWAALARPRLWRPAAALGGLGGVLMGAMARDPGPLQPQLTVTAGTLLAATLAPLLLAAAVDWVEEQAPGPWVRIATRVAAAWIGAIALLLLALTVAPRAGTG